MAMRKTVQTITKRGRYYRLKRAKENYSKPNKIPEDLFIPGIALFPHEEMNLDDKYHYVDNSEKYANKIKIELTELGFKEREKTVNELIKIIQNPSLPCLSEVHIESVDPETNPFKLLIKGVKKYVSKFKK